MSRDFNYESLSYQDRKGIHDALAETTLKHIDRSGGLFSSMRFDPAASPSQMLEAVHLEPVPALFEDSEDGFGINTMASVAGPNLSPLVRETFRKQRAFMSAAKLMLDQHTHIFPVTNHGNIADVAIWSAGWAEAIASMDDVHWQDQNGLVISRGVTTIEAFDMAASEVVQKIGHVFMSFPRTETISSLGFDDSLVDTNNRNMRREVNAWLGEDLIHKFRKNILGKVMHIAWSGKTDAVEYGEDHKPETIRMGKVSRGTIDIVRRGLVLPVAIWDADDPILEIGELTEVKNETDVRRVQEWQRSTLAEALGIKLDAVTVED